MRATRSMVNVVQEPGELTFWFGQYRLEKASSLWGGVRVVQVIRLAH